MFWQYLDDNPINDLLKKDDVTLEEVLDHESLLQECRCQNPDLIKFLSDQKIFNKLKSNILETPSEEIDEKVRFKYSFLSSEVLSSDIEAINNLLLNGFPDSKDNFISEFFSLLEKKDITNPLTMSYSLLVTLTLLKFNNEATMKIIIDRQNSLDTLLSFLEFNAVSTFFEEFLKQDLENGQYRVKWLMENRFAFKCVKLLGESEEINNSVESLFSSICKAAVELNLSSEVRRMLITMFNEQDFLEVLFDDIICLPKSGTNLVFNTLRIVNGILSIKDDTDKFPLDKCVQIIIENFGIIVNHLASPPKEKCDPMPTTMGKISPVGRVRIEIILLLHSIIKLGNSLLNIEIAESNIFQVVFSLFTSYKWNTLLHLSILNVVTEVFSDLSADSKSYSIMDSLIVNLDLYHWFVENLESMKNSNVRVGYSGFMWKIGCILNELIDSEAGERILKDDGDYKDLWSKIREEYLIPTNEKNELAEVNIDSMMEGFDFKFTTNDEEMDMSEGNPDEIGNMLRVNKGNLDDLFDNFFSTVEFDSSSKEKDNNKMFSDWPEKILDITSETREEGSLNTFKENQSEEDANSSSSDEELPDTPVTIKQKRLGTAAKYIITDIPKKGSLLDLMDGPQDNSPMNSSIHLMDIPSDNSPKVFPDFSEDKQDNSSINSPLHLMDISKDSSTNEISDLDPWISSFNEESENSSVKQDWAKF